MGIYEELLRKPLVSSALPYLESCLDELLSLTVSITQIPAPSHEEKERGAFIAKVMESCGFPSVQIDPVGNVLGFIPGKDPRKVIVSMAHMDTVFPKGTDLTVKREGNLLKAPGVGDNSVSIAQMLILSKCFLKEESLPHPMVLIANVGEEGLGDLKGARYFCEHVSDYDFLGLKLDPNSLVFLNIDGTTGFLTVGGIGSRRLKVLFKGLGGHSWGSFGNSSAIHGMGVAISKIVRIPAPKRPRTTYNVGVVSGGHSVNSIAEEAQMLIDMRSEEDPCLQEVERKVRLVIETAAQETGTSFEIAVVGDRPSGALPENSPLSRGLVSLGAECGIEMVTSSSSTDSNIPLSKGWPAVTIGFKRSEDSHKLSEVLYVDSLVPGIKFALFCYAGLLYDKF